MSLSLITKLLNVQTPKNEHQVRRLVEAIQNNEPSAESWANVFLIYTEMGKTFVMPNGLRTLQRQKRQKLPTFAELRARENGE